MIAYLQLFIESLQKRNIYLEVLVVISYINERPEKLMRKYKFECLSVLFY